MKLCIKKQEKNWIYFQIFFSALLGFLVSQFHFPSSITYITDLVLVYVLCLCRYKMRRTIGYAHLKTLQVLLTFLILSTLVGTFSNLNVYTPLRYLWGLRNTGRTFIFLFCSVTLLEEWDLSEIFRKFDVILYINVILCSWQYWVQNLWCDNVGGIFGTNYGCLSYMQLHLCSVCIFHLSAFVNRKESLGRLLIPLFSCFYLATITELKIFYVEFAVFVFIILVINQAMSLRTFAMIIFAILAYNFGLHLLSTLLPSAAETLTIEGMIENLTSENGYTSSGDLSRFTAINVLKNIFFADDLWGNLFGFGLGNCETSSVSILNTPFYRTYSYLNYRWFTDAILYLETGIVGLVLFYIALCSCFAVGLKYRKKILNKTMWSTGMVLIISVIINTIYNSSFRTEAGYMTAFGLSIVFVLIKCSTAEKGLIENAFI